MQILLAVFVVVVLVLVWRLRPLRAAEAGFKFVYVNQDGSVRELSPGERTYLSEDFAGDDSGRPYIKLRYKSRDPLGSLSGFVHRRRVPARIEIKACHPDFDAREKAIGAHSRNSILAEYSAIDPKLSRRERFELFRHRRLTRQWEREKLALPSSEKAGD